MDLLLKIIAVIRSILFFLLAILLVHAAFTIPADLSFSESHYRALLIIVSALCIRAV